MLFSFCFSFLSVDFIEASFIDIIDIKIEKPVEDIKYNSDNKYMYLSLPSEVDSSILVVDTLSNEIIKRITGFGKNPSDIAYNPDNKLLYVINQLYIIKERDTFNYITIINPINGDIIEKVIIGDNAKHILYNPSNHKMYIAKLDQLGIIVMDT
ncbi:MAG: hypothetical protein WCB31_06005 [Nitrososphaeraceae archaeon]